MDSQQPGTASPELPTQPIQSEKKLLLIIGGIVILVIVGVMSYFLGTRAQRSLTTKPQPINRPTPTVIAATEIPTTKKTYKDTWGLLSFSAPADWEVDIHIVAKGKTSLEPFGYEINNSPVDVEVINIQKNNDWLVRLWIKKDFKPRECGGLQGFTKEKYDEQISKYITIPFIGSSAYRVALENGEHWQSGDQLPPYTSQPILFPGAGYVVNDPNSIYNGQILYDIAFCYEYAAYPMQVTVTYLSNSLTDDNIKNKKLDYATIKEMDQILQSFKLVI